MTNGNDGAGEAGAPLLSCPYCPWTFRAGERLRRHVEKAHGSVEGWRDACPSCGHEQAARSLSEQVACRCGRPCWKLSPGYVFKRGSEGGLEVVSPTGERQGVPKEKEELGWDG